MPIDQALAQVEFCEKKAGNFVQMVSWEDTLAATVLFIITSNPADGRFC